MESTRYNGIEIEKQSCKTCNMCIAYVLRPVTSTCSAFMCECIPNVPGLYARNDDSQRLKRICVCVMVPIEWIYGLRDRRERAMRFCLRRPLRAPSSHHFRAIRFCAFHKSTRHFTALLSGWRLGLDRMRRGISRACADHRFPAVLRSAAAVRDKALGQGVGHRGRQVKMHFPVFQRPYVIRVCLCLCKMCCIRTGRGSINTFSARRTGHTHADAIMNGRTRPSPEQHI